MSHTLNVYPEEMLVVVIFEGEVSIAEMVELDEKITNHPGIQISFKGVYDFRNARKCYRPKDLENLKNKSTTLNPQKGKWCSINATPMETGLAELFKRKRMVVHPFEVFSTVDGASGFLSTNLEKYLPR